MAQTHAGNHISSLSRFFRLIELDKKDVVYIYVYALFSGLIALSLPLGIQAIIGQIAGGATSSAWVILVLVVAAGTALTGWLKVMQLSVSEVIQRRIFTRSSFDFAYRMPRMRSEQMLKEYPPELMNRFFDTLTLQKGVPKILMDFSSAILQIVFGLLLISMYHFMFIIFGVVLVILLVAIVWLTGPRGLRTSLVESKYKYQVAYWLEEIARTMNTFKLAGYSPLVLKKTDKNVSGYLDARTAHFNILLFQYKNIVVFRTLMTAGLLVIGSILVVNNQINIGQFVAAEIVVITIMSSAEKIILTLSDVYDVLTALEKIGHVTDLPIEDESGLDFDKLVTGKGIELCVQDLSYRFEDANKPVLQNITFSIAPGQKVCVAGYNGSGKSTLIQIIACLYDNYQGSVTYNGYPMRNINLQKLRSRIGDHSSSEDIFKGSLIENICLGHEDVWLDDVVKVVEDVGLSDFVRQLPKGFDTELQPGGKGLPKSVVTKIKLARGIVSKPELLAIEEMFSNLEQRDRFRIANLLTDKGRHWTMIAVTDDPILAAKCDRIFIMKEGKIIEEGSFSDILNSPHYDSVFKTSGNTRQQRG